MFTLEMVLEVGVEVMVVFSDAYTSCSCTDAACARTTIRSSEGRPEWESITFEFTMAEIISEAVETVAVMVYGQELLGWILLVVKVVFLALFLGYFTRASSEMSIVKVIQICRFKWLLLWLNCDCH